MLKRVFVITVALLIAAVQTDLPASGASSCTVQYYYTSSQNPEPVPTATKGSQSGTKWKIRPAGTVRTEYIEQKHGKTITYTFDGWYLNMNCIGTKCRPGKDITVSSSETVSGGSAICLYGRWKRKEKVNPTTQPSTTVAASTEQDAETSTDDAACTEETVPETAEEAGTEQTETTAATSATSTTAAQTEPTTKKTPQKPKPEKQKIKCVLACTFAEKGQTESLRAKASSGLKIVFASDDPGIVSVDSKGKMKAVSPGSTVIRVRQKGNNKYAPASVSVPVRVAEYRSREAALADWRHLLIDTFFHINGRKYSFGSPGKFWSDGHGGWSGRTGRSGNTQSCITLPSVTLKRTGILTARCGNIWLRSNMSSKPNRTVRRLNRTSDMLSISYPHKSLRRLAANGGVQYGDILCRSGHTFIYMGKDSDGHPMVYESGTVRDIGNGTRVVWGHHSGGHANKLTGKINRQIKRSDAVGEKWKRQEISDAAFKGHRAKGNNLNRSIHIVCSIRTFTVKTRCVNGTISLGNRYMAGQTIEIGYAPAKGKKLDYVEIDGRKVNKAEHKKSVCFKRLSANHTVRVVFK